MKVVLFCGGLGMRVREYADRIPKPMIPIGYRPILWHVMKYYAHFGHKDFILCLGYRGDVIKDYFLNYNECLSNDFVMSEGGRKLELVNSDISDWRITFVETGLNANIGQRLKAVQRYVEGEPEFLANYSDGLTDLPFPDQFEHFRKHGGTATFLSARPNLSYHHVAADSTGRVTAIEAIAASSMRINAGYFILRGDIFDYMARGEELVEQPFQRLISSGRLLAFQYDGFWMPLDTFKDKQRLDEIYTEGNAPWLVWNRKRPEMISRNVPTPSAGFLPNTVTAINAFPAQPLSITSE
jgi:glucose-1-phosphate cytidylyltransferase